MPAKIPLNVLNEKPVIKDTASMYVMILAFHNRSASILNKPIKKVPRMNKPTAPTMPTPKNMKKAVFTTSLTFCLSPLAWYSAMNFTKEGIKGAWESVTRIRNFVRRMDEASEGATDGASAEADAFLEKFTAAVDDDLNMSQALGRVFDFMRLVNKDEPRGEKAQAAAEAIPDRVQVRVHAWRTLVGRPGRVRTRART